MRTWPIGEAGLEGEAYVAPKPMAQGLAPGKAREDKLCFTLTNMRKLHTVYIEVAKPILNPDIRGFKAHTIYIDYNTNNILMR